MAGTRELLLVLDGQLELRVGQDAEVLTKGDSASFAGDLAHEYVNACSAQVARFALTVSEPLLVGWGPGDDTADRGEVSQSARVFLAAVSVAPICSSCARITAVLVMVAEGLEPGLPDQISDELLARAEIRARITLDGRAPGDVPQVADWRAAYRAFGAKPQHTRPSVEALLRRLNPQLPRIDRLTDAYNAVSIANLVPVGGEDLDQYQGPARLVRAAGDEDFDTVAYGEPARRAPHARRGDLARRRRRHLPPVELAAMNPNPDNAGNDQRHLHHRRTRRPRPHWPDSGGNDLASSLIRLSPQAAIATRLIAADQPRTSCPLGEARLAALELATALAAGPRRRLATGSPCRARLLPVGHCVAPWRPVYAAVVLAG